MKKKYRLKKWVIYALMIIFLIGIVYSAINILIWRKNVNSNAKIKEEINSAIKVVKSEEHIGETPKTEYLVDFAKLKAQNEDVVAYIKVNNSNIDYVVVQAEDNSYYLTYDFNKKYNKVGWIFADYKNKFDGTDKNIVIYGHNTVDGSMFGTLKRVFDKEWNDNIENREILFITENGTDTYEIFSSYSIEPEDYYITTDFNNDNDYNDFLKTIKSRTIYNYGVSVNSTDKVLTLSSCTKNGTKRVVLHAKKVS